MKPFKLLGQITTPDGARFSLHEHDGDYFFKRNGEQLMSSTATTSERVLADVACNRLRRVPKPRVLIGGLGLGYSLLQVLAMVGPGAVVHVAELLQEVVDWNRDLLQHVNGRLLADRRVTVFVEDVFERIRLGQSEKYDAILLDVDNGPTSFVQKRNKRLYDRRGFGLIRKALAPQGIVSFWSATEEPAFVHDLERAGFRVSIFEAKAHERAKRSAHRIYAATLDPRDALPAPAAPGPLRESAQKQRPPQLRGRKT